MYENHKLCPELQPKEICLVVEQYHQGRIERKYHLHLPRHRLSETSIQYLLPSLVMKFENNEPLTIVRSFLIEESTRPGTI